MEAMRALGNRQVYKYTWYPASYKRMNVKKTDTQEEYDGHASKSKN